MATTRWTNGNGDGDVNNDANWSGVKPAASDTVIIPALASPANDLTTNLTSLAAIDVDLIIVENGAPKVGASGTPFQISTDRLEFYGSRDFYFKNGTTPAVIDETVICARNANTIVQLEGTGTYTDVTILRGTVALADGISLTRLNVASKSAQQTDVILTATSTGTITTMQMSGGSSGDFQTLVTSMHMFAGLLTKSVQEIDNLYQWGGTVVFNSTDVLDRAHLFGGVLDLTQNSQQQTIGTGSVPDGLYLYGNSDVRYTEGLATFSPAIRDYRGVA